MLKQRLGLGLFLLFRLASELAAAPQSTFPHGAAAYDGSFRIGGLRPGRFQVVVSSPGGLGFSRALDLKQDRDITFDIATGALTGHILTAAGQPVADAVVAIDGDDPSLGTGFHRPERRQRRAGQLYSPPPRRRQLQDHGPQRRLRDRRKPDRGDPGRYGGGGGGSQRRSEVIRQS